LKPARLENEKKPAVGKQQEQGGLYEKKISLKISF
jgi:hypothetical protein